MQYHNLIIYNYRSISITRPSNCIYAKLCDCDYGK